MVVTLSSSDGGTFKNQFLPLRIGIGDGSVCFLLKCVRRENMMVSRLSGLGY